MQWSLLLSDVSTIGINSKAMRAVGARDEVKDDGDEIDYVLFKQLAGRPLSALSATASDSTHSQLPPPVRSCGEAVVAH